MAKQEPKLKLDKTPKFTTFSPKSAGMTPKQKNAAAKKQVVSKPKSTSSGYGNNGKSRMLEEVKVYSTPTPKKTVPVDTTSKASKKLPMPVAKSTLDSTSRARIGGLKPVGNTSTPAPAKGMGRGMTALSDATSIYRGAANLAFGKNRSKTTGGKILERAARLGGAAMGVGYGPTDIASGYASTIARNTDKATGYIKKGTIPAAKEAALNGAGMLALGTVVAPAILGQLTFNKRSEESKKRGIFNPGKGKFNIPFNFDKLNFDVPEIKKQGRDIPLPDSSSLFND